MIQNYKLLLTFFSLLAGFTSFSQTITRGPYLQKGTPTSVVVKWRTNTTANTQIEYSLDENFSSSTFVPSSNPSTSTNHIVEITGLSPYTKYYYRILGSNLFKSPDLFFKTHPTIGTPGPYNFWVLGNTYKGGINNVNAVSVRDEYYSYIDDADTDGILFLGDNGGELGTDSQYQDKVFDMYDSKLKNTIAWSCLGNLDIGVELINGNYPYYDIFEFPTLGESGGIQSNTESYYSFDYGNIHFIVLNSADEDRAVGSSMYNWALSDIQNTTQKWIITFWHQPPFTHGWHNSDTGYDGEGNPYEPEMKEMRENFLPMLEVNGVDLVLTAHSLVYERSYFINDFYGISDDFDLETYAVGATGSGDGKTTPYHKTSFGDNAGLGTVYTVSSTASFGASNGPIDHSAMFYSSKKIGSCILEVEGNNLTLKFLRDTGVIDDYFTIRKDYVYDNGWQGGTDPSGIATNVEDILIKSGDAAITSNTTTNTVVVNPGATLSIDPNISLTANGITLESESNKYSSLYPSSTSSITGTAIYNRYVNQMGSGTSGGNDLVSSPLTSGTMETFGSFAGANPNLAASSSLRAFAPFDNNNGVYVNYDVIEDASTRLEKGKGYRAATDTNNGSPLKFTGAVNIGTVNTTISIGAASKWNLVGNPYTSYLDAQEFLAVNDETVLDPNYIAIYGYNDSTDSSSGGSIWTIISSLQNVGKNIAPGQGFFVASNDLGGQDNLIFTPAMRTLTGTDDFIIGRNSQDSTISHLRLTIEDSTTSYTTDFYFTDNCTLGLDPGYDAGSFDASKLNFSLYSHLVTENKGVDMAIQALAHSDLNDVVVPLGINTAQGQQIKVSINESDLPETTKVYLEDNIENTLTLLNSNDYIFTPIEELNGTGRFFLHFSSATLSTDDRYLNGLQIFTSVNPKQVVVNGKLNDNSTLSLYDIQGRLVLNKKLNNYSNSNIIRLDSYQSGVYIVKLKNGSVTLTKKIIIR